MDIGRWVPQSQAEVKYNAFIPNLLPPEPPLTIDDNMYTLLSTADRYLGRLDMLCELVPDIDFFILMYIRKEATSSSQIEGTTATFSDVLKAEAEIKDPKRPADVKEILNYINAINYGIEKLSTLPLSLRLLKEIHSKLMEGVRGEGKSPGEFRNVQNRIGGRTIETATYVPPPPGELMNLLGNFEEFLHAEIPMPILIKTALIHSQFELLHPFLDGNGRAGRLLITLFLLEKTILRKPLLYLSDYFMRNRSEYYNRLNAISKEGDLGGWVRFFLEALIETSTDAVERSRNIISLRERDIRKVSNLGKTTKRALLLLENLYREPFINSKIVKDITGLKGPNVYSLINKFIDLGILKDITPEKKKNKIYYYKDYIDLFGEQ